MLEPVFAQASEMALGLGQKVVKVPVTFPPTTYNFLPLFSTTTLAQVTGENYALANKPTTTVPVLPVNAGTTPTKAIRGADQEMTTALPVNVVPNPNVPAKTPAVPEKKKNPVVIIGAIGAAAFLAYSLMPKKKASGKSKK